MNCQSSRHEGQTDERERDERWGRGGEAEGKRKYTAHSDTRLLMREKKKKRKRGWAGGSPGTVAVPEKRHGGPTDRPTPRYKKIH